MSQEQFQELPHDLLLRRKNGIWSMYVSAYDCDGVAPWIGNPPFGKIKIGGNTLEPNVVIKASPKSSQLPDPAPIAISLASRNNSMPFVGAKRPIVSSNAFCSQNGSVEMSAEIVCTFEDGFGITKSSSSKGVVLIAFSFKKLGLITFSFKKPEVLGKVGVEGVGLEFENWAKPGIDTIKHMYAMKRTVAVIFKINFFVITPPGLKLKNTLR